MFALTSSIVSQYDAVLKSLLTPLAHYADYKKWLRYFLDFCAKYPAESNNMLGQEQLFLEKLRQKNQSEEQRKQAEQAIKLYIGMQEQAGHEHVAEDHGSVGGEVVRHCASLAVPSGLQPEYALVQSGSSHYCDAGYQVKSASPEWDVVLEAMANEIKVRHFV